MTDFVDSPLEVSPYLRKGCRVWWGENGGGAGEQDGDGTGISVCKLRLF